jgi:hypothetical protein
MMLHQIAVNFLIGGIMYNHNEVIDLENYQSINQTHEGNSVSNKYSFIPTTRVIDVLADKNWLPVKASEVNTRKAEYEGFQKHLIRFRNPDILPVGKGDNFPEIVLTNSHNGLASFSIMAGIFRLVCKNGLIVADSMFASHRIIHKGYTDNKVEIAASNVVKNIPLIANKVNEFQSINLYPEHEQKINELTGKFEQFGKLQKIFAYASIAAKYGHDVFQKRKFDVKELLTPYREKDNSPTLWNTYNVVQEKLLTVGGKFEINTDKPWKRKKVRKVNNIAEDVRINQALWLLAEKMSNPNTRERLLAS